jgi:hypothetical protein
MHVWKYKNETHSNCKKNEGEGWIRKSNRGSEYDQSTL